MKKYINKFAKAKYREQCIRFYLYELLWIKWVNINDLKKAALSWINIKKEVSKLECEQYKKFAVPTVAVNVKDIILVKAKYVVQAVQIAII